MSDQDGVSGSVRGAVADLAAELAAKAADPVQLQLLEAPPSRFEAGGTASGTNRSLHEVLRARGAGRPAGSGNVATREVRDFIRKVFGDPMLETARWMMHTPETLAKELGCTLLEAFDRLQGLREALMPFMHAKLAPVDDAGRAVVPQFALMIGDRVIGSGDRAPWMEDPEVARAINARVVNPEQNQGLGDAVPGVSHDASRTNGASN